MRTKFVLGDPHSESCFVYKNLIQKAEFILQAFYPPNNQIEFFTPSKEEQALARLFAELYGRHQLSSKVYFTIAQRLISA